MARIEIANWKIKDYAFIDYAVRTNKTGLENGVRLELRSYGATNGYLRSVRVFCRLMQAQELDVHKLIHTHPVSIDHRTYYPGNEVYAMNINEAIGGLKDGNYFVPENVVLIEKAELALYSEEFADPNKDVDMYCSVYYTAWGGTSLLDELGPAEGTCACDIVNGKLIHRDDVFINHVWHKAGDELEAKNVDEVAKGLQEQAAEWGDYEQ
jgi:hypothetical protein